MPEPVRKLLLVAAAALIDVQERVLLARRPRGKAMAGLWEFPGGKVEPGERPEAALVRELKEELGIDVAQPALTPFSFASHAYETFDLLMPLYLCRSWRGEIATLESQEIVWAEMAELDAFDMPPADDPLRIALQGRIFDREGRRP